MLLRRLIEQAFPQLPVISYNEIVPGIRYTEDDRYADGYNLGWTTGYVVVPTGPGTVMLIAPPVPIAAPDVGYSSAVGRRKFTEFTPSLSLNYHWSDDLMTYAKYSKGYTSGGFDPVSGPGTAAAFSAGFAPPRPVFTRGAGPSLSANQLDMSLTLKSSCANRR